MSINIRTPTQMTQEARDYLTTAIVVTSDVLMNEIGIGQPFAKRLIGQFQAEGLISGPDSAYKHNVRSQSGELIKPDTKPRATWEDYVLKALRGVARLRGRDV